MPLIPIAEPRPQQDAPALSSRIAAAPRANYSGVMGAIGQLANAGQQDLVPVQPFTAPGAGLQEAGRGITDVGAILTKVHLETLEARGLRQIAEAENAFAAEAADFENWTRKNPDPVTWREEWEARKTMRRSEIFDNDKLAPHIRQRIDLGLTKAESDADIRFSTMASQREFAMAGGAILASAEAAKDAGDETGFNAAIDLAARKGYIFDHEAIRKKADFRDHQERKQQTDAIESAVSAAHQNPEAAVEIVNEKGFGTELKPTTLALIRDRVAAIQRDSYAAANADVADAIVTGKALFAEDVAKIAGNRVRPHELAKLQSELAEYQDDARKAEMAKPEKQRELFGELLDRAWKFDREALGGVNSKAARDEYADILSRAKWLDEVLRGEVSRPLAAKWFAAAPQISGTVKEYLNQSVQDLFDLGRFGQTKRKVPKVEGDEGFVPWEPKFKEVTDEEGLKKARANMADVQMALTAWEKENPKATRIEATAALYQIAGSVLGGDDAAAILEGANRKTQPFDPAAIRRRLQPAGAQGETGETGAAGYSSELVSMVKDFEGFSAKAFGDFKQTSIGYGTRAKHEGEVLNEAEADQRLRQELNMHARGVDAALKAGGYRLTEKQREALISFDFNTGRAVHLLETAGGDLREIERRMRLYTKAGGTEQGGLVKRRKKEADIFAADIR